jgi:O-acetyl-ADP-ribose deacetylase (regulator of RNase III)
MKLRAIMGDITVYPVDAIVNATNRYLIMGGGVCGAIFRAAGENELAVACLEYLQSHGNKPLNWGDVAVTDAFRLPAKHIFHAVGPDTRITTLRPDEDKMLATCYANILKTALDYQCRTISVPAISTGVYGFPVRRATQIAVDTVKEFMYENVDIDEVLFVCFDMDTLREYERALSPLHQP